jgi:ectoine hydroxylase-related dioxygenase (phytanoyl-CoA dioxygenase family)
MGTAVDPTARFLETQAPGALDHDESVEITEIMNVARKLGLAGNIAELEAFGYTVVPAEKVAPDAFQQRLRQAVLDVHERRSGHRIVDTEVDETGGAGPLSSHWSLLREDRVFEELVQHPVVSTLAQYLCGKSVLLSDITALVKNRDERPTFSLHIDQFGTPPPLPTYAPMCNVTWVLTDYTLDAGTSAIVPGSHRFGRAPREYEQDFLAESPAVRAVPIEAAAGSVIVWGGNTWHGAYPRNRPGVRVSVNAIFCRSYMRQIRDFRLEAECPSEVLTRNPPEFAQLLGISHAYPCRAGEAAEPEARLRFKRSGMNPWA